MGRPPDKRPRFPRSTQRSFAGEFYDSKNSSCHCLWQRGRFHMFSQDLSSVLPRLGGGTPALASLVCEEED